MLAYIPYMDPMGWDCNGINHRPGFGNHTQHVQSGVTTEVSLPNHTVHKVFIPDGPHKFRAGGGCCYQEDLRGCLKMGIPQSSHSNTHRIHVWYIYLHLGDF